MDREPPRQRWEREALPRGFNYHDRQAARERNDFPAAKRGRRETSPGYPSYRDTGSGIGPAFPAGPRDRFEGFPPEGTARGRGMPGRGYHPMPEQRRSLYPIAPPLARPPPPVVWGPGPEHRDIRDIPNRQGQFYSQRDSSPTPSPRSWQAPPHALDPTLSVGGPHLHGPPRYGSPAHFDPMAPMPREASHLSSQLRFQEEAERRPSPRALSRPLSRGPSMERAVWQQPLMRGSGPGLGPFVPGAQGPPRPAMGAGPPRRDPGYRYSQGQPQPTPAHGRGRSMEDRARPGSGRGPAPFTRGQGQGPGHDRPAGVPFSRGQGQDRAGSVPRGRGFQQGHASAGPSRVEHPPPGPLAGPGAGALLPRTSSRASVRTPERPQRSGGRDRDGSRDSRKGSHRDRSRDTVQRQHSSSSRPSRAASGATGHSPMRSSGASRDLARRQLLGKHDSPPPKSRLSAPHLATTAASSHTAEGSRPTTRLPSPPAAPTPLPPPPKLPPPAADPPTVAPNATLGATHDGAAAMQSDSSTVDGASKAASSLQSTLPAAAAAPAAAPAVATAAVPAVVSANPTDSDVSPGLCTAPQTDAAPPCAPPIVEEPVPKRPKLQFGKGLASRMSSAAQSELTLPDSAVVAPEAQQQTQSTQAQAQLLNAQADAQPDSQTQPHSPGRAHVGVQLKSESHSPPAVETSLEDLLAQNSPGSLHRSSWVQIHKDLLTLNNHKARLQESISDLAEQERILKQEVEQAQAQQEAEDHRRQQQLQGQRASALQEEERIASQLNRTEASIAQLHSQMQQVPPLPEVSQSEGEDLDISSSDGSDSELSDADPATAPLQNGSHHGPPLTRGGPDGMIMTEFEARQLSLTQMLQQLRPDNRPCPPHLSSFLCDLGRDQLEGHVVQVCAQNSLQVSQDRQEYDAVVPPGTIPIATDRIDVPSLPLVQKIVADHECQKHTMMCHLRQRRAAKVRKQIGAAARYNAAHEQLQIHSEGRQAGDFTHEERARIEVAKERICAQVKIPDQILDRHEKRDSIFVNRNNQYDLREAREVEQASLRMDPTDQKKFGAAFVKFPKKWGKVAEVMGDRTPFQCAMIYNDQKDYDWFHPWLSQYGRTKRRTVGNRQQRFLSSANAMTARPDSAERPPRGRVTTVVATAVTNQGPWSADAPSRAARGRSRGAAARGLAKGPALRGRPSRTGGISVATAVVTATEGEEAATMDTAAVVSSTAGAASTVTRNRYELDLPWTAEEERLLLEGYRLHTKQGEPAIDSAKSVTNWRAVALHVGSRTQKAAKAHMKKLQADSTSAALHQPQHSPLLQGALPSTGQPAASSDLGTSMTHAAPSSSAGPGPMDVSPGALEAVERLEGSPPPENGLRVPVQPHHQEQQPQAGAGFAEPAAATPDAQQQQQQQSQAQAEAARLTDNLLPDWTAAASGPFPGAGLIPAPSLPQGSAAGAVPTALGPLAFPGQAALHPAILQFLFGQLGQAQQLGQPQGAPQGQQQLPQPVPMTHSFMLPYQAFVQQQMAAVSSAGFPQQPFGSMPPYLQPPPGLGSLPQPLLPGHFGMLQPPGVGISPSQALLQPPESSTLAGGSLPLLPGVAPSDQPFILQPPFVSQLADHGAGLGREWPQGALQGQDGVSGPERGSLLPGGAAEQLQGEVKGTFADRQDSASQGQQETAPSLQADSAPGSSTGPDGPPSVSKGGRRGGSKATACAPKRQMNFWQEEEKAQFLNAYRMHGVDWDTLAKEIPTKEKTQIKNYYQNYKQRLELDQIELPHSAKHPKPSRGPSRGSTPRPGSARAGSRQLSECGEPLQAMMDEAVEAAKAAAAAAVTNPTDSQAMDIEVATVSHAVLPGRDSGDSHLRGNDPQLRDGHSVLRGGDNQLRGNSPDAASAVPMSDLPPRGTPVRGMDPTRAVTPPPRSNTPPLSHVPSWGPADGIRQAWQGGALTPNAPTSEPTPRPRVPPSPSSCWGLTRMRRGRPSLSPQAPSPTPAMPEVLQATPDAKPLSLLTSSSANRREEEVQHSAQPGGVSAAGVAKEVAEGLPVQASSSLLLGPTAVSVSVSVQDNPVSMSAVNAQGRPTLLPHSSLLHHTSTTSSEPLVPSVLRGLAAGQGRLGQPQHDPSSQPSPHSPSVLEHRSDTQASLMSQAPAGTSGLLEQPPAPQSSTTGHDQDPSPSEAAADYNLSSAISQQFESLPGRTPPSPSQGLDCLPLNRPPPPPQPKQETEASTPGAGMQASQDGPGVTPSESHLRRLKADRLISGTFDRLEQGSLGDDTDAAEGNRLSDS